MENLDAYLFASLGKFIVIYEFRRAPKEVN